MVNIWIPGHIVLGGGGSFPSPGAAAYRNVPASLKEYVFGRERRLPLCVAQTEDARGRRGADAAGSLERVV